MAAQAYVHRVGRTGRAGQAGTAVTLLCPADAALEADLRRELGHAAAPSPAGAEPGAPEGAGPPFPISNACHFVACVQLVRACCQHVAS